MIKYIPMFTESVHGPTHTLKSLRLQKLLAFVYWTLLDPSGSLLGPSGSFWVLLGPSAPGTWELTPCLAGRTFIFHKAAKQQPSWHWPGNQDGDKKCVCMVLVGTSDTDEVVSPSVQRVNFYVVIAENNNSRPKQNNSSPNHLGMQGLAFRGHEEAKENLLASC